MTPKEKAYELCEKHFITIGKQNEQIRMIDARKCALITVDQVLESIPQYVSMEKYGRAMFENPDVDFWNKVKTEIESL